MTNTLAERFWRSVDKAGQVHPILGTPCWVWTKARTTARYGVIRADGDVRYAHRLSWEWHNARPVPDGMLVLHRCDNPPCVNPDHLFVGSQQANMDDMLSKGRSKKGRHKSHCIRGHKFTPDNTYVGRTGGRTCRECANALRRNGRGVAPTIGRAIYE